MVPRGSGPAPIRRFFLARSPEGTGVPELLPAEAEHATRVLRLSAGDRLVGLDGAGGAWPLVVLSVSRRGLELARAGEPARDPQSGTAEAVLPWIEVAAPLPRGARAEAMLDRLTQLGVAALHPLISERSQPAAHRGSAVRFGRLERIAIEACKQSGRTWMMRIETETTPAGLLASRGEADVLLLDPTAETRLFSWLGKRRELGPGSWTSTRPLVLAAGPEGGFTDAERDLFVARGASTVRLHPYRLRIETAVEAAVAIVAAAYGV